MADVQPGREARELVMSLRNGWTVDQHVLAHEFLAALDREAALLARLADAEETMRAAGDASEHGNYTGALRFIGLYFARHESPAGTPEDTTPTKGTVV
jgi:hypothetical protein